MGILRNEKGIVHAVAKKHFGLKMNQNNFWHHSESFMQFIIDLSDFETIFQKNFTVTYRSNIVNLESKKDLGHIEFEAISKGQKNITIGGGVQFITAYERRGIAISPMIESNCWHGEGGRYCLARKGACDGKLFGLPRGGSCR